MNIKNLEVQGKKIKITAVGSGIGIQISEDLAGNFIIWQAITDAIIDSAKGDKKDCLKAMEGFINLPTEIRKSMVSSMVADYEQLSPEEYLLSLIKEAKGRWE